MLCAHSESASTMLQVALAIGALSGIALFFWLTRSSRQGGGYESVGRESYAEEGEGRFLKGASGHSIGTPDSMISITSATHLCQGGYSTAGPRSGEVGRLLRADPALDASPKR